MTGPSHSQQKSRYEAAIAEVRRMLGRRPARVFDSSEGFLTPLTRAEVKEGTAAIDRARRRTSGDFYCSPCGRYEPCAGCGATASTGERSS